MSTYIYERRKRVYGVLLTSSVLGGGVYLYFHNHKTEKNVDEESIGLPIYTEDDVACHSSKDARIWVSYAGGVYDVTDFVDKHPGGGDNLMMGAGSAIDPFWKVYQFHKRPEILEMLEQYRIGSLAKSTSESSKNTNDPYGNEPVRNPILKVNSEKPFNAEPPTPLLIENFHTPSDIFYIRNHLPVPEVDEKTYRLEVDGLGVSAKSFSLEDLKTLFRKVTITSTIQCAGNQRSQMKKIKPIKGLNWDAGAIGNAIWSGVLLKDVLNYCDLNLDGNVQHVQFSGLDTSPSNESYGASIPIEKATDPNGDVLLAYEMNGETLPIDHGFPLRVVVPGVVGARCVKWLERITVSDEESDSFWQRNDYKVFSPSVDWDTVDFTKASAIQELPVISAICDPVDGQKVHLNNGKVTIKGYAWSGGGRKIIRVDVTADGGKNWQPAEIVLQDVDAKLTKCWSWVIWHCEFPVSDGVNEVEIWSKAVDSSCNTQPETFENVWNLRGVTGNAYHRIRVTVDS